MGGRWGTRRVPFRRVAILVEELCEGVQLAVCLVYAQLFLLLLLHMLLLHILLLRLHMLLLLQELHILLLHVLLLLHILLLLLRLELLVLVLLLLHLLLLLDAIGPAGALKSIVTSAAAPELKSPQPPPASLGLSRDSSTGVAGTGDFFWRLFAGLACCGGVLPFDVFFFVAAAALAFFFFFFGALFSLSFSSSSDQAQVSSAAAESNP